MKCRILGIQFDNLSEAALVSKVKSGGLTVVPSGPGLAVDLRRNADYRKALLEADTVVTDSGAMVLFWRLRTRQKVQRISGLRLLQALLRERSLQRRGASFWVHPSETQRTVNDRWLQEAGFDVGSESSYCAPQYPGAGLADEALWLKLQRAQPQLIVLCIGGGVQERLGYWLRARYMESGLPVPAIVCTGAAIGFLSGNQTNIPTWADRLYLGWFLRCLFNPTQFLPRYWRAVPLFLLVMRYGERLPELSAGST